MTTQSDSDPSYSHNVHIGAAAVETNTSATLTTPLLGPCQDGEHIFDELPSAVVIEASRPEAHDISHFQLVYTIEVHYKQVRLLLNNK